MSDVVDRHVLTKVDPNSVRIFDAGFLFSVLMALALLSFMPDLEIRDFDLFWKAALTLKQGVNPYVFSPENSVSLNSPIGLGLLWFLGSLPYHAAKQLYLYLMYFSFFWSVWVGYKIFLSPLSHNTAALNMVILIAAIPFGMFFQAMTWGSMTIFVLIGITAFYCLDAERRPILSGCCLGLCLIKPHLFIVFLSGILWWSIRRRQILLLVGFMLVFCIATLSVVYLQPDIFQMYKNLYSKGLPHFAVRNASVGNILYSLFQQKHVIFLFAPSIAGLCLLPFVHRWHLLDSLRGLTVFLLPWSILLSPYCWGHDYSLCFATSFFAAAQFAESFRRKMIWLAALLASAVLAHFVVGTVLSPAFRFASFVFYGFILVAMSVITIHVDLRLRSGIEVESSAEETW